MKFMVFINHLQGFLNISRNMKMGLIDNLCFVNSEITIDESTTNISFINCALIVYCKKKKKKN